MKLVSFQFKDFLDSESGGRTFIALRHVEFGSPLALPEQVICKNYAWGKKRMILKFSGKNRILDSLSLIK